MNSPRPERLIYLLDTDDKRRLRCEFLLTRLLNWKSFQPAPIKRLSDLMHTKFAPYLRDEDRRIVMRLLYWEKPDEPVATVGGAEAFELLREIVGLGRAFLNGGNKLRLEWADERPARPEWTNAAPGSWTPNLALDPPAHALIATEPPCYFDRESNVAGPIATPVSPALAGSWINGTAMTENQARTFCLRLMNRFPGERVPLTGATAGGELEQMPPKVCLKVLQKDANQPLKTNRAYSLNELALVEIRFAYGPRKIDWNSDAETVAFEQDGRVRRCSRDREAEEKALSVLYGFGFENASPPAEDGFLCFDSAAFQLSTNAPSSWRHLLEKEFPRLRRDCGWHIELDPALALIPRSKSKWFEDITPNKGDWFSFEAGIVYDGKRISILNTLRAILRDHQDLSEKELIDFCRRSSFTVPIENEGLILLPGEQIAKILKLLFSLRLGSNGTQAIRVSGWQAAELADAGVSQSAESPLVERLRRLRREVGDKFALTPLEDLPELPQPPRDYQRLGLAWLDFLQKYELGGILADDMGLGKTMQVLVHLLREKQHGRLAAPCLVVAPTSVLDSWEKERKTFAPDLRLLRFHGAERKQADHKFHDFNVVITSYAVARIDVDLLRQTKWSLVILDEAQKIKNPDSETARSLFSLSSRRRLCLTGTPIENHLGELWSLFHFLMPGFLGDRKTFAEKFRKPVENQDSDEAQETATLLSNRLHPFLLRRKKDQVVEELPPRTEITRTVPLAPRQAELYESTRIRLHRQLANDLEKRGIEGAQIQILDALLKLRQTCCDPRLHQDAPKDLDVFDSAKLSLLIEMLDNLLEEGRTVLVFSQFVTMLNLIAGELDKRSWKYLELTGETKDRGRVVEAFQAGEAPLFLISLKAGGAGLNLTAADTVIQYDPWWNPAVEQQAADRAYRIGQDKPVFHYRLIATSTVEEKILYLQREKQALVDSILDGLPVGKTLFDKETIDALFAPIEED